jgi:hypothetical protein
MGYFCIQCHTLNICVHMACLYKCSSLMHTNFIMHECQSRVYSRMPSGGRIYISRIISRHAGTAWRWSEVRNTSEIRQNTPKYVTKSTYSALYPWIEHTIMCIRYAGPRIWAYFAPLTVMRLLVTRCLEQRNVIIIARTHIHCTQFACFVKMVVGICFYQPQ